MSFRDCISSALNQGQLSAEEARDLVERFERLERFEAAGVNGPEQLAPKARLAQELRSAGADRRRQELLAVKAKDAIYRDVRRYAMLHDKADIVGAANALFENFGTSGFSSVRGIYQALLGAAHSEMAEVLRTFRRSSVSMRRLGRPLLDDVVRAGFGENVSENAQALYRAWSAPAEKLRALFNDAGGHIGWLENWGLPTVHREAAVLNAGFDRWAAYVMPRLDWDKMQHAVSGAAIQASEREAVLRHVYDSIVSGGFNKREPSMTGGGVALYNRRADQRFLTFKNADAWLDYNRSFGWGDPFQAMTDHLRSMARDVALMQRLGPNPAAMVEYLKQLVASEGAKLKRGEPSLFPATRPGAVNAKSYAAQKLLDGFYDVARGASVPNSLLGDSLATWRNVQYSAKLGGAVIMHTAVNPVIMGMGRYLQGHPVLTVPLDLARSFVHGHELERAGMIVQDAMTTLERGAREQGALMKVREFSNWLPAVTAHYSGLEAVVAANRRAAFLGQMTHYAALRDTGFDALPARVRNVLIGFGLDAEDWDRMQAAEPHGAGGGAMLRWQDVRDAAGDAAANEATAMKYLALLHGSTEVMVPSSNWRVRAAAAFADTAGALPREIVRSALMFKSGFMATFMLTQWQLIARDIARGGIGATVPYIGASIVALTAAGMVALQLKQLRAGKDFRSMDATTAEGRATWEHALLTSGALGIYGDFIASDTSSYGHDLLSTLAGPTVTGAVDAVSAAHHLFDTKKTGAPTSPVQKAEGGLVSFLRNNTPVLSTHWATQAAYNRVILDQLQFMADPAAHQKMRTLQNRVLRDTGQGYFWPPGETRPTRAPQLAK